MFQGKFLKTTKDSKKTKINCFRLRKVIKESLEKEILHAYTQYLAKRLLFVIKKPKNIKR
jgi:hypothetical protein